MVGFSREELGRDTAERCRAGSSTAGNWRLIFAAPSYRYLLAQAKEELISTSRPSARSQRPRPCAAAGKIAGSPPDSVAVVIRFLSGPPPTG